MSDPPGFKLQDLIDQHDSTVTGQMSSSVAASGSTPTILSTSEIQPASFSSPWTPLSHYNVLQNQPQGESGQASHCPQLLQQHGSQTHRQFVPYHAAGLYTSGGMGRSSAPATAAQPSSSRLPEPSPSTPPPESYQHWDIVLRKFLQRIGFLQALRGFECDILVMNSNWERSTVPGALEMLLRDVEGLGKPGFNVAEASTVIEERKLDHCPSNDSQSRPLSNTSLTKSISQFLAKNRAKNDTSNRAEFLLTLAEKKRKRQKLDDEDEGEVEGLAAARDLIPPGSCARTDARSVDRDSQMKYDIARNEEGPLSRTVKSAQSDVKTNTSRSTMASKNDDDDTTLASKHPGLAERIVNLETHLAVRYVPCPPRTLLMRLQLLEDHIVKLERDYPPWAALHFNQPRRGWPPPPRSTPIIVPPHQREVLTTAPTSHPKGKSTDLAGTSAYLKPPDSTVDQTVSDTVTELQSGRNSSLRRAVLQKLEIQKAMTDLGQAGLSSSQ